MRASKPVRKRGWRLASRPPYPQDGSGDSGDSDADDVKATNGATAILPLHELSKSSSSSSSRSCCSATARKVCNVRWRGVLRRLRRRSRSRAVRLLLLGCLLLLVWDTQSLLRIPPTIRVEPTAATAPGAGRAVDGERYFIASMHWNNEAILRSHWNDAVVDLARHLGAANTYVAVLESGSWDGSRDALTGLRTRLDELGVGHRMMFDNTTHADVIDSGPPSDGAGWVMSPLPDGTRLMPRRIPYLASLRNRLVELLLVGGAAAEPDERPFTKIIWLNDVVFSTADVLTLLATNGGDFAAACALDFAHPPGYYDTFALRGSDGVQPVTATWPYFSSARSRRALVRNEPVPVMSCWNGIAVFDAGPFLPTAVTSPEARPPMQAGGRGAVAASPAPTTGPLRFRGVPDSLAARNLDASECCLIHADNPLSTTKGVFVNPNVRVGYSQESYDAVKPSSTVRSAWNSPLLRVAGMWRNRTARWLGAPARWTSTWAVHRRMKAWRDSAARSVAGRPDSDGGTTVLPVEAGAMCVINEKQILVWNGWKHL